MKLNLFRRSQPVCEPPKEREVFPQREIPRERWLKRFIESYRRNCMQMEMLSDYTKSLEDAYRRLQQENQQLKKDSDRLRSYMMHINEAGAREFELKLENRQLKTELNRRNQLLNAAGVTASGLYSDYKTAIRGQYYYIHYLKTLLHLHNVFYKKKLSFNTLEFDNIDELINEAVNDTNFTK